MSTLIETPKLPIGTLIRHKSTGYEGRIDGITEIKFCFTKDGAPATSTAKDTFQYRVEVAGESLRRIAPAEDLEILEGAVTIVCTSCAQPFQSKPGIAGKAGGRCGCGAWICPVCLSCQAGDRACSKQTARKARKLAAQKKAARR